MDPKQARQLAYLPHRQSFYKRGGWKQAPTPDSDAFRSFLCDQFSRQDLKQAEAKALLSPNMDQNSWGFIHFWDPLYPLLLREIFDPPPILFYQTTSAVLAPPDADCRAVVGTRRAHKACLGIVRELLMELRQELGQLWSVSGFAYGVDRIVHYESLRQGVPTMAVLGSGIGCAGPKRNLDLIDAARQFNTTLIFISEYPHEMPAHPWHFPRRNRIIAGLGSALYCIQAPAKSGAMISARFALEEGRDVFACDHPDWKNIPGANEGGRQLLAEGASPIPVILNPLQAEFPVHRLPKKSLF